MIMQQCAIVDKMSQVVRSAIRKTLWYHATAGSITTTAYSNNNVRVSASAVPIPLPINDTVNVAGTAILAPQNMSI